jgi:energy-coupling factor transport system ATP-binding protein
MIRATGLGFRYQNRGGQDTWALRDISLQIESGAFVALIGPNGSGKSTLARHFNALLLPGEGEVLVRNLSTSDEANRWRIRQLVGMVFQNPDNQLVASSVEEDVAFGPENLGLPGTEIRERVEEALALTGMTSFRQHAPHLLSGGQKQRVAIAGVIAMRPQYLVLDEPTAMLDPRGRQEVMETVIRLNRQEGITVIYITHFMEEALTAERLLVLSQGRLLLDDHPRKLFQQAQTLRALGLGLPDIPELVWELRAAGLEVPPAILNVDELAAFLCS